MKGPSLKKTRLSPAAAKEVAQFEQEWNLANISSRKSILNP